MPPRWSRPIRVETVAGAALKPLLSELARLRIELFREFPYLFDGEVEFERTYLSRFADTPGAAVIVVRDGTSLVGAATCQPLAAEQAGIQKPFADAGMDVSRIFYFGEAVLKKPYRGRGIGVTSFKAREALAGGYGTTAFYAVDRPDDHPRRTKDYVPLCDFWRHRGYHPRPELACTLSWREVGDDAETRKKLIIWTKVL